MSDKLCDNFQKSVDDVLVRHASLLDVITKLQDSSSKINRAAVKTITNCGCVKLSTLPNSTPEDAEYTELRNFTLTQTEGDICPVCKEKIEQEIGNNLFYLAALCNHFNLSLNDVLEHEKSSLDTLGKFSLY
ncbi:MAG: DUF1573 domain-containing protein [Acidaminobacteraceae bacterium]